MVAEAAAVVVVGIVVGVEEVDAATSTTAATCIATIAVTIGPILPKTAERVVINIAKATGSTSTTTKPRTIGTTITTMDGIATETATGTTTQTLAHDAV